jgi:hypothetical protein
MKILSIDVGIKNLAICVIEADHEIAGFTIKYWDVINLCEEQTNCCEFNIKVKKEFKQCNKVAKFHKNNHYFCKSHASKSEFKVPTPELNKYKRLKLNELQTLISDYEIPFSGTSCKATFINAIENYIEKNVFEHTSEMKCRDYSLIDIGCSIKKKLDQLDELDTIKFCDIDHILIENQISPIANRMTSIQGMLTQYFIMKDKSDIRYISASNKLKPFIGGKKTTYGERKKMGVEITKKLLFNNEDNIIDMFNKHKKKDDLADCFLQGIWFIITNEQPKDNSVPLMQIINTIKEDFI